MFFLYVTMLFTQQTFEGLFGHISWRRLSEFYFQSLSDNSTTFVMEFCIAYLGQTSFRNITKASIKFFSHIIMYPRFESCAYPPKKWTTISIRPCPLVFGVALCGGGRGEICPCRHCRRQWKLFNSGVNFSGNNAIYNINESSKYILSWFHL